MIPSDPIKPDPTLVAPNFDAFSGNGTLLIVDDDQANLELMSSCLQRDGYDVATLQSGAEALEWIRRQEVDIVLLDVDMPGMSGLQVLRTLRQQYSPAQLPVIMVSGRAESPDIEQALNLGATDYVVKPMDSPLCLTRVKNHLSAKRVREALRKSEEGYDLAARASNDGLWDWDLKRNEIKFSARWKSILGLEESDLRDHPDEWFTRVHPEDLGRLKAEIDVHLEGITPHCETEYRMLHRDGNYRWMLGRGLAVRDASGVMCRMAGSQTDITRTKVADALTGLPNRMLFMDRLGRMLERARRSPDYLFALIFLNLDGFKLVNESLGQLVGDQLLVALSNRIEVSLRSGDTVSHLGRGNTVARLGGDDFTILLDDVKSAENATLIADRIVQELSRPFDVGGGKVSITASIGIALSNAGYQRPEDLLRDADTAMYRAKTLGKARYELFDADMRAGAVSRLQLEAELRRAVERQEFENYYQLLVCLQTGRIQGVEALVRWQHPSRGLILPAEFIAVAEDTGLIIPIGQWSLREACRKVRHWQARFPSEPPLTVSINLCSKHFMQSDLIQQSREILQETGLPPGSLSLEITESAVMPNPEASIQTMLQLKSLKIKLAIDDFGTGYSSLSYLHRFPIDTLKIDRSFVIPMGSENENPEIVRTIVHLAHNLGLTVVAEGVENAQQLAALRALGCECAQGYYFSHPLDAERAADLITARPKW